MRSVLIYCHKVHPINEGLNNKGADSQNGYIRKAKKYAMVRIRYSIEDSRQMNEIKDRLCYEYNV